MDKEQNNLSSEQKTTVALHPPAYFERVLFMGANGSGKSQLAREFLPYYKRWVVVDLKGDFEPIETDYIVIRKPTDWRWKFFRKRYQKIVYRPGTQFRSSGWWNYFFELMWEQAQKTMKGKTQTKPFILYVDEGLMTSDMGGKVWMGNHAVGSRALGIGLWVSAQRPKHIPVAVRSEAWRWYVFYLSYKEDEKEVAAYAKGRIDVEDMENALSDYHFFEIRRIRGGGIEVTEYPAIAITDTEERSGPMNKKKVFTIGGIVAAVLATVVGFFALRRKGQEKG